MSVDVHAKDNYIEALRNMSRNGLADILKKNFCDPKTGKFQTYGRITKSYAYYGMLELCLNKLWFKAISVTGLWWPTLKRWIAAFERKFGLVVDEWLAGRQVLAKMYELARWYGTQPYAWPSTHADIIQEEPQNNDVIERDRTFYRKPRRLIAYLNSPAYKPGAKPRVFVLGLKSGTKVSWIREKRGVYYHGSACTSREWDVGQWFKTWDFHYLVLPSWDIVQFVDDNRGHGALGGNPVVDEDRNAQQHGIAVEFSCPRMQKRVGRAYVNETFDPNKRQVAAGNFLLGDIQHRHNREMYVGLSIDWYAASSTKHTDTLTWRRDTLRNLGVWQETIARRDALLRTTFGVRDPSQDIA